MDGALRASAAAATLLLAALPRLWLVGLGVLSVLTFLGSLAAVPVIVARLPSDYFLREHRTADWFQSDARRLAWLVAKNVLGGALVLGGLAMLVLPGQGVLVILLGLALLDVPGRHRLLTMIAVRPRVWAGLNALRRSLGAPELLHPGEVRPPAGRPACRFPRRSRSRGSGRTRSDRRARRPAARRPGPGSRGRGAGTSRRRTRHRGG